MVPRLPDRPRVLDVGGRDVNGTPRDLLPAAHYVVMDQRLEPGVDLRWDATRPFPTVDPFDLVVSTETFEHVKGWPAVLENMAAALNVGGFVLVTAACDPRQPHSGIDGWELREGEFYGNVDPGELEATAARLFRERRVEVDRTHGDVYLWGVR